MKLKKLLLPIASVASISAVVVPIVTSCGGATCSYLAKWDDKTERPEYKSEYEPLAKVEEGMDDITAHATYFDAISKDKKILADDFVFYSQDFDTFASTNEEARISCQVKVSASVSKVDKEKGLISATFSCNFKGTVKYQGKTTKVSTVMKYTLKSFPMIVKFDSLGEVAIYSADENVLRGNKDWTATYTDELISNGDGQSESIISKGKVNHESEDLTAMTEINFSLHYMSNQVKKN